MGEYTWIPLFNAISKWLVDFKDRQEDLVNILSKIGIDNGLTDEDAEGNKIPLTEIDPFTFFSMFMKYGHERCAGYFEAFIRLMEIDVDPPTDFAGLPSAQATSVWLFPYARERNPEMIATLWAVFGAARDKSLDAELFDRALKIPNTGFARLTEGLFYAFPDEYLPINAQTIPWLPKQKIEVPEKNWKEYKNCLNTVRSQFTEPFAELSHRAYLENRPANFNAQLAVDYLQERFPGTYSKTSHIAAFKCSNGRELAFDPSKKPDRRKTIKVFVSHLPVNQNAYRNIESYPADRGRNNHLQQHAPSLAEGNEVWSVTINSQDQIQQLCDWYSGEIGKLQVKTPKGISNMESQPLNQILFGPPGTGKTYATTDVAVKIADPDWYTQNFTGSNDSCWRSLLKKHYDELVDQGRIVFTTFHQSFAYEDFVEGIRAESDEETKRLSYPVVDGVFKQLVNNAEKSIGSGQELGLSDLPRIWKISIDLSGPSTIRDYCFQHNQARVGWGDTGDLSLPHNERSKDQIKYWNSLSSTDHSSIQYFSEEMAVGDVVLCLKDRSTIQAVGVVTSDYWFDQGTEKRNGKVYPHVRNVKWLFEDIDLHILPINNNIHLTLKTVYPLDRTNWEGVLSLLNENGYKLKIDSGQKPNFVMIIDEINRGNIGRIFGELITLLETSKRKGADDARTVVLPYSKDPFSVPANVYVVGTMNTADRSLATLDIALRRRFKFIEVPPTGALLMGVVVHGIDLAEMLCTLNERIEVLLDRDHMIGHSYFLGIKAHDAEEQKVAELANVFSQNIIPLLQEYFFDDWERIGWVLNDSSKSNEDRFIQQGGSKAVTQLFSSVIAEQLTDRRFEVNESAFTRPGAYQGILSDDSGESSDQ